MTARRTLLDIPLSPLGFGCYALGGAYGQKLTEAEGVHLLHSAYELGFRFFDTANSYGNTEHFLGRALGAHRHDISLVTKVGLTPGRGRDLSSSTVLQSCERSLHNLRTDYIDLYQVHFDDPTTPVEETIEALDSLKEAGKIRHYGVGHLPLRTTQCFIGLGKPSSIMLELSPVATNRYREIAHILDDKPELELIAFSITGRGLLSGRYTSTTTHRPEDIRRIDPLFTRSKLELGLRLSQRLASIGHNYGMTPSQVAIAWVLKQPRVAVALTGPTRMAHLEENWRTLQLSMDQADQDLVNDFVAEHQKSLEEVLVQEVRGILQSPLSTCLSQARADLVYALDYCAEGNMLESAQSGELIRTILRSEALCELRTAHHELHQVWSKHNQLS